MASVTPLLNAPSQDTMHPAAVKSFAPHQSLLVKQTAKGCCQECFGCEARSEYKISGMDWEYLESTTILKEGAMTQPDVLYAIEQSSFCMRLCWRDGRSFSLKVSEGGEAGGAPVVQFNKPCGCPLYCTCCIPTGGDGEVVNVTCPCCCCLPQVKGVDPAGVEINRSVFICDKYCCVPKLGYMEANQMVYILRPDTCCGGCCVLPKMGRRRRTYSVPFYFWDPVTKEKVKDPDGREPQISKVWAGLKKECCTTADTFATFFPQGSTPNRKAGLIGLTLLLDFTVFERQGPE